MVVVGRETLSGDFSYKRNQIRDEERTESELMYVGKSGCTILRRQNGMEYRI